jgi:ribose 5-phosphate isomerase A
MNAKQEAADAALEFVKSDTVIGLGTGSTADCFIQSLGAALKSGRLRNVRGVPTSIASDRLARGLNIPIVSLSDHPRLHLAIDGADEVDPQLNLIKGLGGALLREKIIAQSAEKMIVIVDNSKLVPFLGSKSPLPIEVAAFSHEIHIEHFRKLGAEPVLRKKADGSIFETDNGNYIYDCRFARIDEPSVLQTAIRAWAGVVDTGLFINIAAAVLVGSETGVKKISR